MNNINNFLVGLLLALLLAGFSTAGVASDEHNHDAKHSEPHDDEHGENAAGTGPNGGRLLVQDALTLEVLLSENAGRPEFRLFASDNGKPLAPEALQATLTLERLGGRHERLPLQPRGNMLVSQQAIAEPHSFDVGLDVRYQGQDYNWHFASYEGRTELSADVAAESGIVTEPVASGRIRTQAHLFGVVSVIPEQQSRLSAVYPGIVQSVAVRIGDKVKAGQLVATVQNAATLKDYAIKALADGEVTNRFVNPGERVNEQPILEISDLSTVYVEMSAFPADTARMALGNPVMVRDVHGTQQAASQISYIAPQMTGGHIARVRAVVQNSSGAWRPGMHVKADVEVAAVNARQIVKKSALQEFNGATVVFIRVGDLYEVRMPQFGASDDSFVEVLSGLEDNAEVVSQNSFLIKADILKSGASHEH